MAHLAVLHWRIWAPLVYLNEDIDAETTLKSNRSQPKPRRDTMQRPATVIPTPAALIEPATPHHAAQERNMSVSSSVAEFGGEHEADTCGSGARV
jgi:hypothetical protein